MSSKQTEAIKQKLDSLGVHRECECCGSNHWMLLTNFASVVLQTSDAPGLTTMPVVVIECMNCGHLRFFRKDRLEAGEEK